MWSLLAHARGRAQAQVDILTRINYYYELALILLGEPELGHHRLSGSLSTVPKDLNQRPKAALCSCKAVSRFLTRAPNPAEMQSKLKKMGFS